MVGSSSRGARSLRPRHRAYGTALALMVALPLAAGCSGDEPPEVAAEVAGVDIFASQVDRLTSQWVRSDPYEQAAQGRPVRLPRKESAKQVLGFLIKGALLDQLAADLHIDDQSTSIESAAPAEVPAAEYEASGWASGDFSDSLRHARLSKAIAERLFPQVETSEPELRELYDRAGLSRPGWEAQVRAAYFAQLDVARRFRDSATVANFESRARELGAGEVGDLGTVTPQTTLPQPILDAIGGLAAGDVSEPIQGGSGYLMVVVDGKEGHGGLSFDQATPELRRLVEDQRRQQLFQGWFDERLKEALIEVSPHYGRWDGDQQSVV